MSSECIAQVKEIKYGVLPPIHEEYLEEDRYDKTAEHQEKSKLPSFVRHEINDGQFPYRKIGFNEMIGKGVRLRKFGNVLTARSPELHFYSFARERLQHPHDVGRHGFLRREAPMGNADKLHRQCIGYIVQELQTYAQSYS